MARILHLARSATSEMARSTRMSAFPMRAVRATAPLLSSGKKAMLRVCTRARLSLRISTCDIASAILSFAFQRRICNVNSALSAPKAAASCRSASVWRVTAPPPWLSTPPISPPPIAPSFGGCRDGISLPLGTAGGWGCFDGCAGAWAAATSKIVAARKWNSSARIIRTAMAILLLQMLSDEWRRSRGVLREGKRSHP